MAKPIVPSLGSEEPEGEQESFTPLPRLGGESELDQYIHLGESTPPEEDLFEEPEEIEEEDSAPIPRIERDIKLEDRKSVV